MGGKADFLKGTVEDKKIGAKIPYKGWLNSHDKLKNPEEFNERIKEVCEVYPFYSEGLKSYTL